MRAWLYQELNRDAKAWPYYVGNRAKQRESIRHSLDTIRRALATHDAHVVRGRGGNVLHYEGEYSGNATLSGFGDDMFATYVRLGLPAIDCDTADFAKLCDVVIRGPMIAHGSQKPTGNGSLGYRPLIEVAAAYRDAGATVHNIDFSAGQGELFA